MKPATLRALQHSIIKWENIVAGTGLDLGQDNCALCKRFVGAGERECAYQGERCPVYAATGQLYCRGSPYDAWDEEAYFGSKATTPALVALAQAELDFLRSLLPERGK